MKKPITTFASFIIVISLYAQTQPSVLKPEGMEFVPQGSFQMNITRNSVTKLTNVSVAAFWMSNEITNAEFREFVEWANKNPNEKLYKITYSPEVVKDPKKGTMKDTTIVKILPIEVSKFNSQMIDPLCLEKVNAEYNGYFSKAKYNDYPVVGVSFIMAEYYCLWKTMMENKQMKEKGLPNVHAYRIPLETEWEYVAQPTISMGSSNSITGTLQKVNIGASYERGLIHLNKWGLFHLNDNVSEWVSPGIVRGGSWKTENGISSKKVLDLSSQEPYIGFRIVQSYLTVQ